MFIFMSNYYLQLLYWYNCPRYSKLKSSINEVPEIKKWLEPYQSFFTYLSEKTGTNITTTEDVFFLDNLFQTLVCLKLTSLYY